jgi:hypothetical protein
MNAKLKKTELSISLADIGYKTADNIEGNYENATLLMIKDPSFPETISDETRAQLTIGFQRKYKESKNGKVSYYLTTNPVDGVKFYVPLDQVAKMPEKVQTLELTIDYVNSLSGSDYKDLNKNDPAKRRIVEQMKKHWAGYKSDCIKALVDCAKKIKNQGTPTERKANKTFRETLEVFFNGDGKKNKGMDAKVKLLSTRNDLTADPVMYRMAKEAFFKVYTKK